MKSPLWHFLTTAHYVALQTNVSDKRCGLKGNSGVFEAHDQSAIAPAGFFLLQLFFRRFLPRRGWIGTQGEFET